MVRTTTVTLALLSTLHSEVWAADWVTIEGNENGTFYVDKTSIRRAGSVATVWSLTDFTSPRRRDGKQYYSFKGQVEYDCEAMRVRPVFTAFYSEGMGNGSTVTTSRSTSDWQPVIPESIGEKAFKIACGK
jgi:hypothetical protein